MRGRPGSLATVLPYMVLTIRDDQRTIAVAENPLFGNATYVIDEGISLASWEEVASLEKREAREMGGIRFVHSDEFTPNGIDRHYQRVLDRLVTLI